MGWKKCQKKGKQLLNSDTLREPFHILTVTLLSLLLPLSFLLLARFSSAHYPYTFSPSLPQSCPLIFSLFLYTSPTLLHVLVSIVSVTTLTHGLTGKITLLSHSTGPGFQPRLYTAWIFLCTLQVCVGLGIEGSIAAGVDGTSHGNEASLLSRLIFFLGLHETMLHWSRTIVKPVVDDTVFGVSREESWAERVAMATSISLLWWWSLRKEVDSLIIAAEAKKELLMGVGVADFVGWWLYYITVTIGMVRIVKGLMWLGMVLFCRRVEGNNGDSCGNEDKV